MKLITSLLTMCICLPFTWACGKKQHTEGSIQYFEYYEFTMRSSPRVCYRVERDGEGTLLLMYSFGDEMLAVVKAPANLFDVIDSHVKEGHLWNLKNMYVNRNVLDGTDWSFYCRYDQGSISSSGSNKRPLGRMQDSIDAILSHLKSLTDQVTEADILGNEPFHK